MLLVICLGDYGYSQTCVKFHANICAINYWFQPDRAIFALIQIVDSESTDVGEVVVAIGFLN